MSWMRQATTFALIALLLGVLLAACGDDEDDDIDAGADIGDETEVVVDPTEAEDEEPTPTEAEATEDETAEAEATEPEGADPEGTETPMTGTTPPATGSPDSIASPQAGIPGGAVTIDDILDNPEAFVEEEVTVTGDVVEVLMTGAFTISAEEEDGEKLLVVGAGDLMPALDEDSFVMVQGQVDMLTLDGDYLEYLREEFDIEFEDEELLTEFDGQPVIAASSVSLAVTSIDELIEAPDPFIDQMVTLTGPVVEQLNPLAFVMGDAEDDWIAEESLLVVGPSGVIPPEIDLDAMYQVRGTVRIFDSSDTSQLGDEYAFLSEDEMFADFEGLPIIVAEEVEHAAPSDALSAILDDPDSFVDQTVQVTGNVTELVSMSAFTVGSDETDDDLLVVTSTPTLPADLSDGAPVTVSGTIMLFDLAAVEEELEVDLEDDLFAGYDGEPVLVADMVMADNP